MRLHRLFTVGFTEAPDLPGQLNATIGSVTVRTHPLTIEGKPTSRLFVEANVEASELDISLDAEGYLQIGSAPRMACECAMELAVDGMAVLRRIGREISSVAPFVALSELSPSLIEKLSTCRGLRNGPRGQFFGFSSVDLADPSITNALTDRRGGVALLAEVLSTNHPVGKYRALLRFFENAFALTLSQAEKKLSQLLGGAELGYTRDEVREWLALRDGSVHGDLKKTPKLVLESDIRHVLARMQQAAYDVLLNKTAWHSPSSQRRSVLPHYVATTDRAGHDFHITRGKDAKLITQYLDPFGCYVVDLSGSLTSVTDGWWCPAIDPRIGSGRVATRDP